MTQSYDTEGSSWHPDKRPGVDVWDYEYLLTLPFIHPKYIEFIPKEHQPGPPTSSQKTQIRQILRLRSEARFPRCKGQSKRKVLDFEKKGDYSHSGWLKGTAGYKPGYKAPGVHKHKQKPDCDFCEKCRCHSKAGSGTRGDFYGLGPETGTLGVGFCRSCLIGHEIDPRVALQIARRDANALQLYGDSSMDTEYALKEMKAETAMAEYRQKVREEVRMLADELERVRKEVEGAESEEWLKWLRDTQKAKKEFFELCAAADLEENAGDKVTRDKCRAACDEWLGLTQSEPPRGAFEYVKGEAMPMSTDKRARMIADITTSRMYMRVQEDTKLDRTKVLQVDHVIQGMKGVEQASRNLQRKTDTLARANERLKVLRAIVESDNPSSLAKTMLAEAESVPPETDRPVCDYTWDLFGEEFMAAWMEIKRKAGQGVK